MTLFEAHWLSSRNFFWGGGGGKIYCYANFFCHANFSIVFGPNFRGAKVSEGGKLPRGEGRPPVEESQPKAVIDYTERSSFIYKGINFQLPNFSALFTLFSWRGRNMNNDNSCLSGVGLPVALSDTLESFGNQISVNYFINTFIPLTPRRDYAENSLTCFPLKLKVVQLPRRFLRMTKMPLLPIRKLPEVSSIGQVS